VTINDTSTTRPDETAGGWTAAFAPASVANVGPGFDCFGFALEGAGDLVSVRASDTAGVVVTAIEGTAPGLPRDPTRNTAAAAAAALWDRLGPGASTGLEIRLAKGLPVGSGLGSSAASAVAAAVATMRLLERSGTAAWDQRAVLGAALDGEAVASGQRHADNVAPSLLGGFTLVQSSSGDDGDVPAVARLEPPPGWCAAVVTPDVQIDTREARALLPARIPLDDAAANWSNAAGLVLALVRADAELARRSLCDRVVEPVRARLIPGCAAARAAALEAGAIGSGISGSGPSLFAIATERAVADRVGAAMADVYRDLELECALRISPLGAEGARAR
jgi:homoserine kinase